MPTRTRSPSPHLRIVVGLPNLQDHVRMVDRLRNMANEPELSRWSDLAQLLSELYTQLQHQKQVTVYRFGSRSRSKASSGRRPA
ncbi:MAG: hypothetical protein HY748_12100 [Elusimicrobia bacterium]|nr:hypothetical protein [Elusimicrobiota bacterium]